MQHTYPPQVQPGVLSLIFLLRRTAQISRQRHVRRRSKHAHCAVLIALGVPDGERRQSAEKGPPERVRVATEDAAERVASVARVATAEALQVVRGGGALPELKVACTHRVDTATMQRGRRAGA